MKQIFNIFLFFTLIINAKAQAQELTFDTMTVNLNWKGIKNINPEDGKHFNTIDITDALYLGEFNYLPVVESGKILGKISQVKFLNRQIDTLSESENFLIHSLKLNPNQTVARTVFENGSAVSTFLLNPFFYDSVSDKTYKITGAKIVYQVDAVAKNVGPVKNNLRASNSVLSDNEFYKIGITSSGIYKINNNFLDQLGIDTERIDPRKIKIFGNGGGMLPQPNSTERQTDLFENAIEVVGETDGSFDDDDYILFYGQGQHLISLNEDNEISYSHNIYSDTTYYFLTTDGPEGKRLNTTENIQGTFPEINTYNDLQVHEINETNILNSGREWFGERFDAILNRNYSFNTKGVVEGSEVKLIASALGQSLEPTTMEFKYNNSALGEINFTAIPDGSYVVKGILETSAFTTIQNSNAPDESIINLKFNKISGVKSSAYLNYMLFECIKKLEFVNTSLSFRSVESSANTVSKFTITGATNDIRIWNVTNPLEPTKQIFQITGNSMSFNAVSTEIQEYVIFNPNSAEPPVSLGSIAIQDIKGNPAPDLIIVCHPMFYGEAKRLAQHRSSFNNLEVLVFTTQQVYNEFSSGAQDVTAIRDMARYFYLKGNETKLKNLLLFGKTSFDYKDRIKNNTNFVPTYSSRNSVHPVNTYSSDDYYGFMEENEGEWQESYSGDHTLDIGVGRLPVKTVEEAKYLVDKLISYDTNPNSYGEWKKDIYFIADDGDSNIHQRDADNLATYIDTTYTSFNTNKIFVDAFEQEVTSAGEVAPEVNLTIDNSVKRGGVIFNYTGHGSEIRWCSETVLDIRMINKWENIDKLPLFVTATCEFGRHDEPRLISGGEQLLLNPNGGAIGLVTTSRPVFSNSNYLINYAFYRSVFEKENNEFQDLGSIFKNTKNRSLSGSNNRNFSLLGDPSMKLAFAKNEIEITAELQDGLKVPGDTLEALEVIKIKGKIVNNFGSDMTNFNGILTATVFDKQKDVQTLGDEGSPFNYKARNSLIFNGDISVTDGQFTLEFIIPKDISFDFDKGKISLYAKNDDLTIDASGSDLSFLIGGSSNGSGDTQPPEITLFINDTSFQNLGLAGSDIIALGKIFDENGINILNDEMNEGIVLSLDDQDFKYVGNFFKNELNTYKTGWLNYPISELEDGYHKIVVGANDTYNNYSENEIEFYVANSDEFYAENLYNYPNPFKDVTNFTFEHNRAGDNLELTLIIYDLNGRLVYNGFQIVDNSRGKVTDLSWDGRIGSGKKLEGGVYLYTIKIRSLKDNLNYFLKNKLLIIN